MKFVFVVTKRISQSILSLRVFTTFLINLWTIVCKVVDKWQILILNAGQSLCMLLALGWVLYWRFFIVLKKNLEIYDPQQRKPEQEFFWGKNR